MKGYLVLILLICTTLQAQTNFSDFSQASGNQIDYFKMNPKELLDDYGNKVFSSNESDSLVLTGESIENYFGRNVSNAGDVNGDGFDDIIVSAPNFNFGIGRVYIYYGGSSMDNISDLTITGETANNFGYSISTAGDVNGDGFSDIIVGAPDVNILTTNESRAYLFYGGSLMNNVADVVMIGSSNYFSFSVSTAGDVNGDGYSDVIIGSHFEGKAFIYFGGFSMNSVEDILLSPSTSSNNFGYSVSTAGDVNSDGFSDVLIGSLTFIDENRTGEAFIYYGGTTMNTIFDVMMSGETQNGLFGYTLSTAGDVNNDGFDDVIVGAYGYNISYGRAYVYFGSSSMNNVADVIFTGESSNNYFGNSVSWAGDVNGDGYSDVIVGCNNYSNNKGRAYIYYGSSSMNNVVDIVLNGEANNNDFGVSVSTAGDVNGDGYSDVIVGAHNYSFGTGRAYFYSNLIPKPDLLNPINNSINNPLTINFNWKKFNSAIFYILLISTDSAFNNIIINDTIYTDTAKIINGFQKGLKYFWRIRIKDTLGVMKNSAIWNFTINYPIYVDIKLLFEGMYNQTFNQLSRKDSITLYLRDIFPPFFLKDSAKNVIDTIAFSNLFKFNNATTGSYYIVAKHFNCIETWSKSGGESLNTIGLTYYYDLTNSNTQAYGNNLKLKGSKYCIYSGDVNQDGFITLYDVIPIYNDSKNFVTGRYLVNDLNGDNFVDLVDMTICSNNSKSFIRVMRP